MDPQSENGGVEIIIKHQHSKAHNASLLVQNLSRFVIAFLKKNRGSKNKFQQLKNIVYKLLSSLYEQPGPVSSGPPEGSSPYIPGSRKKKRYSGIGVAFGGRAYGAKKASTFKMLFGSVPFNTLSANIDYSNITEKTRNGT